MSTSWIDDVARELMALAQKRGAYLVALEVRADGRVEIRVEREHGHFLVERAVADLTDESMDLPSEALRRVFAMSGLHPVASLESLLEASITQARARTLTALAADVDRLEDEFWEQERNGFADARPLLRAYRAWREAAERALVRP